jgi:hypothetical protein
MHRTRVQTGNPGFGIPGFGHSRIRSFTGSAIPGFGHSRVRSFPVPGIPGLVIRIVAVEVINYEK